MTLMIASSESRYGRSGDGALSFKEFETAVLSMASPVDRRAYALAAAIGIAFAGFSVTFPMGPVLIETFAMSQLQFGSLTTAFALAKLCGNIPSSILSEVDLKCEIFNVFHLKKWIKIHLKYM